MLIRLIPAIVLLAALFWTYHRWKSLAPAKRKAFALKAIIFGAFFLCVFAVISGHAHWLTAVFTGLVAAAKYGIRFLPFLKIFGKSRLFKNSNFKTEFLDVQVDLQTGQVFGSIISGPHQGATLDSLSPEDLETLENHYKQHDKTSYYLIRMIRQRGGHQYREQEGQSGHNSSVFEASPSTKEALQILGLEPEPNKQQIIKAHRALIQKLHPDRGGNDFLASRVNLAKEALLKHIDHS